MPEGVTEEVEEAAARDWLELESTFELDVDASGLEVVDVETGDNWEVEELLESTFELEEMAAAVVELDAFDIVVPLPAGGAIA